jgi:hypothetical protein
MNKERIPGGKSKGKSLKDIAKMHVHGDPKRFASMHGHLKTQLGKGMKTELEHTSSEAVAREIAMDHLFEDPNYYKKLEKMEKGEKSGKIGLKELSEMVKKAMNEEFEGGVNYDTDIAIELKGKVGQLSKLTPYVLELGNRVVSDVTGKVSVYEDSRLVRKFNNVDDFLKGVKYGPVKISEGFQMGGKNEDHEASMAKAELRSLVGNTKALYTMIEHGDELPGWVSAYVTLASDYISSVTEYMKEQKSGGGQIDESSEGKSMKMTDLAAKYELRKTGATGKFQMSDFQPILDDGTPEDKYALALNFANMFLGKNIGLSWDDLPDVNSLWDCVESSETIDELIDNVKESCRERISEEGGEGMLD